MTEAAVLYAAIAFLFGALGTVAKVTWAERGKRVEVAEKQATYYREEIPKLFSDLAGALEKQDESMNRLADVVELAVQDIVSSQKEGTL